MLNRDSAMWTLAVVAALLTYLSASQPPTMWSYYDWIRAVSAVVGIISAKLSTSPLPGAAK